MIEDKVKKATVWITSGYILTKAITFLTNIVFARVLFPYDFGLYAQALVATSIFLEVSSFGIDSFIVYKQEKSKDFINSAFALSLFFNLILFLLFIFLALPISKFYFPDREIHNALHIKNIILILAILYLVQPFRTISIGILTKNMEFNLITKSNVISNFIASLISIIIAVKGAGVWTLVFYNLIERISNTAIMMFYLKKGDCPLFSRTLPFFQLKQFKEILNYGIYIAASALIWYIILNIDIFLIGKYFGSSDVGFYSFSMKQATILVSTMGMIVGQVTFPVFATLQNNKEHLQNAFIKTTKIVAIIGIPLSFFLFLFAPQFIISIFGEKWSPSIIPFRIFIIGLMTRLLFGHATLLMRSIGRTDLEFKQGIITLPFMLISILVSLKYGIIGVSFAVSLIYCISALAFGYISAKIIGVKFKYFFVK